MKLEKMQKDLIEVFLEKRLAASLIKKYIILNRKDIFEILKLFFKRFFDIFASVSGLILFAPFFAAISVAIKISSKGSILFKQKRLGRDGRLFTCLKFRTMYEDADQILHNYLEENKEAFYMWKKYRKIKGSDPRITPVGRFLRKSSLDELPQLLNVLKGEMSIVGPRPYIPEEITQKEYEYFKIISQVKPGITGLWQVSGRNKLPFKMRLKLDAWYAQHNSIYLDFIILIKTVKVVIKGDNAY